MHLKTGDLVVWAVDGPPLVHGKVYRVATVNPFHSDLFSVEGYLGWLHSSKFNRYTGPDLSPYQEKPDTDAILWVEADPHLPLDDQSWLEGEEEDDVYRPEHYARWTIEPVEFLLRNNVPGHTFNIVKYAMRAGYKTYPGLSQEHSEIKDLRKAIRYAEMRINLLRGKDKL